jgi:hypothetical protein
LINDDERTSQEKESKSNPGLSLATRRCIYEVFCGDGRAWIKYCKSKWFALLLIKSPENYPDVTQSAGYS